jgi:uncharacterized protein YqjF (DUF2071 family)
MIESDHQGSEHMLEPRVLFRADWLQPVFIHFRIDPMKLEPHVPFELDLFEDSAYVSLVAFTQSRLRPAALGRLGEVLSTPLACHEFLNLRTYVRHGNRRGIYFIAEWIPNRLAVLIGPRLYGLPYRLGRLDYRVNELRGRVRGEVCARGRSLCYQGFVNLPSDWRIASRGSLDHFLLERYVAWTYRQGTARRFEVAHESWPIRRAKIALTRRDLLDSAAPFLRGAPVDCGHVSPGVRDVSITVPIGDRPIWSAPSIERVPRRSPEAISCPGGAFARPIAPGSAGGHVRSVTRLIRPGTPPFPIALIRSSPPCR